MNKFLYIFHTILNIVPDIFRITFKLLYDAAKNLGLHKGISQMEPYTFIDFESNFKQGCSKKITTIKKIS